MDESIALVFTRRWANRRTNQPNAPTDIKNNVVLPVAVAAGGGALRRAREARRACRRIVHHRRLRRQRVPRHRPQARLPLRQPAGL
eukprot:3072155-Pyramimonas_sp.AAC.1